jgi:hypothetical protein
MIHDFFTYPLTSVTPWKHAPPETKLVASRIFFMFASLMGREYKIKCALPQEDHLNALFKRLPNPIHQTNLTEIYNYKIEADGFYLIDRLVDSDKAAVALRLFLDCALLANQTVEISEP